MYLLETKDGSLQGGSSWMLWGVDVETASILVNDLQLHWEDGRLWVWDDAQVARASPKHKNIYSFVFATKPVKLVSLVQVIGLLKATGRRL